MKKIRKIICALIVTVTLFVSFGGIMAEAASSAVVDLGDGYSARIDAPHDSKTGKWHGHISQKGKNLGSENVDGTKHDGKNFDKVPKKKLAKLKESKKWAQAKDKNSKLVAQRIKLSAIEFAKWLAKNLVILDI